MLTLTRTRGRRVVVTVPPSDVATVLFVSFEDLRGTRTDPAARMGFHTVNDDVVIDREEVHQAKLAEMRFASATEAAIKK